MFTAKRKNTSSFENFHRCLLTIIGLLLFRIPHWSGVLEQVHSHRLWENGCVVLVSLPTINNAILSFDEKITEKRIYDFWRKLIIENKLAHRWNMRIYFVFLSYKLLGIRLQVEISHSVKHKKPVTIPFSAKMSYYVNHTYTNQIQILRNVIRMNGMKFPR